MTTICAAAIDSENLRKRLLMQLLDKEEKQTEVPSDSILVYLELTPTDVGNIDKPE